MTSTTLSTLHACSDVNDLVDDLVAFRPPLAPWASGSRWSLRDIVLLQPLGLRHDAIPTAVMETTHSVALELALNGGRTSCGLGNCI